jgi:protein TonB
MGALDQKALMKTVGSYFAKSKVVSAGASGLFVTLSLFYLMSQLISGGQNLNKSDDTENFIEFVRIKKESLVQERKRQLPKKPPEPKKPPPPQKLSVAADQPNKPQMKMNLPKLSTSLKGNGPYLGPGGGGGGSGVTPIVRIEPQYPRKAAMQGIQGWVQLSFDITAMGTVDNVKVIQAKPKRIFDMAAKRALLKWKYRPKMEDGKAVPQPGEKVQLEFKLE